MVLAGAASLVAVVTLTMRVPQPPNGVILEDPERIRSLAPRMMVRAVVTRTMPLGNLTGMTEEERALLGAWVA